MYVVCGLYVVGSSLNGFGNNSSDMDLCLMITNQDVRLLYIYLFSSFFIILYNFISLNNSLEMFKRRIQLLTDQLIFFCIILVTIFVFHVVLMGDVNNNKISELICKITNNISN